MAPDTIHTNGPWNEKVAPMAALQASAFHAIHRKTNRFSFEDIDIVTIRVCAAGRTPVLREHSRICYEILIGRVWSEIAGKVEGNNVTATVNLSADFMGAV
jgi:hypothetical protein